MQRTEAQKKKHADYMRQYFKDHPEIYKQQLERSRIRRLSHRDEAREYDRRYRLAHPDKVKANNAKWGPIYNKLYSGRHLVFKGKHIWLQSDPRTGVCSSCGRSKHKGEIKNTNMHHIQYDPKNPLAHTVELCVRCHMRQHLKTHCRQGHEYNSENTRITKDGKRICRICNNMWYKNWKNKKRI